MKNLFVLDSSFEWYEVKSLSEQPVDTNAEAHSNFESQAVVKKKVVPEDDEKEYLDRMVIRSYSSMILFIPTFVTALVMGIVQLILNKTTSIPLEERIEGSGYMNIMGIVFFIIFTLNFILVAFDFDRMLTIILSILVVAIVAVILLINAYTDFLTQIWANFPTMRLYFSTQFYFCFAIVLFLILLFTWFKALFNYYVIEGNELLHHKGFGGGVERWPATNMSVVKEFPDLIELLFFRSGTLILSPPRTERAMVLTNVFFINKKIEQMNEILGRLKVDID